MSTVPLRVDGLKKVFPTKSSTVNAVDGVSFEVREGELYTLLGPSGCGKTSTLRSVAGLEHPDDGEIAIGGHVVSQGRLSVPPNKRDIGMVFQNYGIWPHMSVFDNAAFPLQVQRPRVTKREIAARVGEALAVVHLDELAGRAATQLSGGQQQRLALARALVRRPKLLLLDEPLSNLDAKLREAMRMEVTKLQRDLGIATLFVTHDQDEALSMSSRLAVLDAGRIVQEGTPREIYQAPATRFVADFVGRTNFLEGQMADAAVTTDIGLLRVRATDRPAGSAVTLSIRPEAIRLSVAAPPAGTENVVRGALTDVMYVGERAECHVRVGDHRWLVRLDPFVSIEPETTVWLELPGERISLLGGG